MTRDQELAHLDERIVVLEADNAWLRREVREWLCEGCRTIYPGPPRKGFSCIICPKCGGLTGPRMTAEMRALEVDNARLREALREAVAVQGIDAQHVPECGSFYGGRPCDCWVPEARAALAPAVAETD